MLETLGCWSFWAEMRTHMDPLIPTTSTLEPAIAHIAETAVSLAESLQGRSGQGEEEKESGEREDGDAVEMKPRQRETVQWVLAAPARLKDLVEGGQRQKAAEDWAEVRELLEKWEGVEGADEVKKRCLQVMMHEGAANDAG
ncbi:MAG: hypothetical protein Q9207_001057 [Kuettlingeria erythrocarpa]